MCAQDGWQTWKDAELQKAVATDNGGKEEDAKIDQPRENGTSRNRPFARMRGRSAGMKRS